MSWSEYLIRLYGYERSENLEWIKTRRVAYASLIGSHLDPKKLPKSEMAYMPLNGEGKSKDKGISQSHQEAFLQATKQYLLEKNERRT